MISQQGKLRRKIDTSLRYGSTSIHGLNIVLQRMRPFYLYIICSKQDPIGELGVMHLLKVITEIGKDPNHLKNMWVVLLAFTMKLKRNTTYLLHPTPKLMMLL
jgi:hypothetical protein